MDEINSIKMTKPPFTKESALHKVQCAQDAWNSRDPLKVIQGYSVDSKWRNRSAFFCGRDAILEFLKRKWEKELEYILEKELWAFTDNRISVRFEYEWRDADSSQWYHTHGNEHWEFDDNGLMKIRDMSANDIPILESMRRREKTITLSYPKRVLIAVIVSMPIAFGLNFSMNSVESLMSKWMIVVINAIVISSDTQMIE